jgi:hypothetical protein
VEAEGGAARFGRLLRRAVGPVRRLWESDDPIDDFALVHMASAAGDALVAVALADSVFFSIPVGEARGRVALYLALTVAPLAVAAPFLVPLLDRGGFRRAISFGASAGRAVAVLYAAPRVDTLVLFPAAFVVLVLSRVHAITKNGLTVAYASSEHQLMPTNARLSRLGAVSGVAAAVPGLGMLAIGGASAALGLAAAVYALGALLNLQLQPHGVRLSPRAEQARAGRIAELGTAAAGQTALRAAHGFLVFLIAFALRAEDRPAYWVGVLVVAGLLGAFIGDWVAPHLSRALREEVVVLGSLVGAGAAALFAFRFFALPVLAVFTGLSGMALEFGRLAFGSLMQRHAPGGAHGRVFVRYEILFQSAWVAGAFVPAMVEIEFRTGVFLLAAFDVALGLFFLIRPHIQRRWVERSDAGARSVEPGS